MLQEFESEILSAGNNSGQPVGTPDGMNSSIEIVRSYIRGDINGDWCIDIVDALLAAQYFVGLLPLIDIYAGDVNGPIHGFSQLSPDEEETQEHGGEFPCLFHRANDE